MLDAAFGTGATQAEVFERTVKPLAKEVMEGYNATLFAVGRAAAQACTLAAFC